MQRLHDHDFHPPLEKSDVGLSSMERPNSALAVVSLVFGILAWPVLPVLGALIAVVTGHAAVSQIREERGRLGGRSLAQAGMILGYIQLVVVAAVGSLVAFYFLRINHVINALPAPAVAVGRSLEVKLADAMDASDFAVIDSHKMNEAGDEVIALSRGPETNPADLALLTTRRLVVRADGGVEAIELAAITEVRDLQPLASSRGRCLEVVSKGSPWLKVWLPPGPRGDTFQVALTSAGKVARDLGKGEPKSP